VCLVGGVKLFDKALSNSVTHLLINSYFL
jgi:hypothetical protein